MNEIRILLKHFLLFLWSPKLEPHEIEAAARMQQYILIQFCLDTIIIYLNTFNTDRGPWCLARTQYRANSSNELNKLWVNRSEVNRLQVFRSKVNRSKVIRSKVNKSKVKRSKVIRSKVNRSKVYRSKVIRSKVNRSKVNRSKVFHLSRYRCTTVDSRESYIYQCRMYAHFFEKPDIMTWHPCTQPVTRFNSGPCDNFYFYLCLNSLRSQF